MHRIDYVALEDVMRWPRNPKKHAEADLDASMERFGFIQPLMLDEATGRIVAGHGRLEALQRRFAAEKKPPSGIGQKGKQWLVPVVRGVKFANENEAEAYLLADNKLTEEGGWDKDELAKMLGDLKDGYEGLDALVPGFDVGEIDRLLRTPASEKADAPVINPKLVEVKLGDLFIMGKHRLLCGDSTKAEDVTRLLNGATPNLMVTDPPYGIEYDAAWRDEQFPVEDSGRKTGVVENDTKVDWRAAWELFTGNIAYVWHAGLHASEVQASLEATAFVMRAQIIWSKQHFVVGRGAYHPRHEPCWYAVKKGKAANWQGGRDQSTVWDVPLRAGKEDENDEGKHSTQKPVELFRRSVANHTVPGDGVYEPFSGSGTCLIACQTLDRACYAMELSPEYVAQTVARWEAFTGEKAVRG